MNKQVLGEALLLSWLYYTVYCFFSLSIIIFLSSGALNHIFNDQYLLEIGFNYFVRYRIYIFFVSIFFFPVGRLIVFLYLKIASNLLVRVEDSINFKKNLNPLIHYFYADVFYLIPLFGPLFRFIAALYYLYISLIKGTGLSRGQFYGILLGPFILLSIISFFIFAALILLIASDIS